MVGDVDRETGFKAGEDRGTGKETLRSECGASFRFAVEPCREMRFRLKARERDRKHSFVLSAR